MRALRLALTGVVALALLGGVGVENEGGTWLGRAEWFGDPPVGAFGWTVLEGQGDYAGLTAFLHKMFHPEDGESEVLAVCEGELPPYPELPAE